MLSTKDVQVGKKFGRWTVLEINVTNPNSKAKKKPKMALCQCECGTIRYKEYRDLYSGRSLSCGCLRTEQVIQRNYEKGIIQPGTQFGYLTFIKDLGYRKQNSRDKNIRWALCKCICGNEIEVSNNNLKSGTTKSCGCIKSYGERVIETILKEYNINYSKQYSFSDLFGPNNGLLRFDFAIFYNNQLYELIEFDGRQHFEGFNQGSWHQDQDLQNIQNRDNLKNEYCKQHNIKLIRIPYFQLSAINIDLLELTEIIQKDGDKC